MRKIESLGGELADLLVEVAEQTSPRGTIASKAEAKTAIVTVAGPNEVKFANLADLVCSPHNMF